MSALPVLAVASSAAPPSSMPMPVAWARVLGSGPFSPDDFGHHVATNAAGEALVSAQLDRTGSDTAPDGGGRPAGPAEDGEDTCDLSAAQLVKLAPDGRRQWTLPLRAARLVRPPSVALDDHGCAYVVGPFAPIGRGLRFAREMALTKLEPSGTPAWSRSLGALPDDLVPWSLPVARVAAAATGGACVTWVGRGRRWMPALRGAFVTEDNRVQWEHAWPIAGEVRDPQVAMDAHGAAVVWGELRGAFFFAPGVRVESAGQARHLARVQPDGTVCWAQTFSTERRGPSALALGREGTLGIATILPSQEGTSAAGAPGARSELCLLQADIAGTPFARLRAVSDPHASIASVALAAAGREAFMVAGYFSGRLQFGATSVRSRTSAHEAIFVARAGAHGEWSARAFQGPQLQGGLSVNGTADGSALVGGWLCGSMRFGEHSLASPRDRMALFLAKLAPH